MIKKASGYQTEDGKMWATLDEAAGHLYGKRLRAVLSPSGNGVFGVDRILKNSHDVAEILAEYNAEIAALDEAANE